MHARRPAAPAPVPAWMDAISSSKPTKTHSYVLQRDFKVLEREQKVTTLLGSEAFRSELENILRGQLEGTGEPKKTKPQSPGATSPGRFETGHKSRHPSTVTGSVMGGGGGGEPVIPINDLRGTAASKYTVAERDQRCKLASVYRLVHMFGWSQLIYNHITAHAPGEDDTYLVNAFGLLYHEVTASNLVRVNLEGEVIDPGSTRFGINKDGFVLHSAIHEARRDIGCVLHLHTNAGIAVSSMNCGLLPISGEAIGLGGISYHDFNGYLDEEDDYEGHQAWREKLTNDLGPSNKVLVFRNHGLVTMGGSIEETFHITQKLVKACEIQVAVMSAGLGSIHQCSQQGPGVWSSVGVGVACMGGVGGAYSGSIGSSPRKWRIGELEFEALMRMLDNKGYNTGYRYKGLGLLEPGTGTPTINRRDRIKSSGENRREDHWDFLDDKKLAPDEPLTKVKYLRQAAARAAAKLDESKNATASSPRDSSRKVLSKTFKSSLSDEEPQSLTPLEHVQQIAKQVAQSTGEAVERLQSKRTLPKPPDHLANHDDLEDETLTPLQRAQLTAERVARSTGEAVERLQGSKLDQSPHQATTGERPKLPGSKNNTMRSHHHTTPKRHVAPDTRKLENMCDVEHKSSLSPLERAEITAKRVALSTGKSLEKLSKSQTESGLQHSPPLFESTESGSDTSTSGSECSRSTKSETRLASADHLVDLDHLSSLERVRRTAEMVAGSTGAAVQKLSSSLSDSI